METYVKAYLHRLGRHKVGHGGSIVSAHCQFRLAQWIVAQDLDVLVDNHVSVAVVRTAT